jgi:hypothetical protein
LLKAFKKLQIPNARAMSMEPTFKTIQLLDDEVNLAINLIDKEINEHILEPQ